jgi:hypothetical protein
MEPLVDALARLIAEHLEAFPADRRRRGAGLGPPGISEEAREIARDLVSQAIAQGIPANVRQVDPARMSEGSTAQMVARVGVSLSFVFKLDNNPKLVEEARILRRFSSDENLPREFRKRFPTVFALKSDLPPFAYLMEDFGEEDGYKSLSKRLFAPDNPASLPADARYWVDQVLDVFLDAFAKSLTHRMLPNIEADYLDRIEERLSSAAKLDDFFGSRSLTINDTEVMPWKEQLEQIRREKGRLRRLLPPFSCAVHGDPNPENIMLKVSGGSVTVKLIDPKAWERGDYVFDLTKIAHYIWAIGPVEKASTGSLEAADDSTVRYTIRREGWVEAVVNRIRDRTLEFATRNGDDSRVDLRWHLGMASTLLGVPGDRWAKNRRDEATILYAEGLLLLDQFRRKFLV